MTKVISRRNILGWLAGMVAVGGTSVKAAEASKKINLELKWSAHSVELNRYFCVLSIDCLTYGYMSNYSDDMSGKLYSGRFTYMRYVEEDHEVHFDTFVETVDFIERNVLDYITNKYQLSSDNVDISINRDAITEILQQQNNND